MTSDELIAKCRELALTPRAGDDELDAMSAEEAWDRCCYAAWVDQKARRQAQAHAALMADAHAQVADLAVEMLMKLSPEERTALTRAASEPDDT